LVDRELLQRVARDPWHDPAHEPAGLAHLDDRYHGAVLFKGGKRSAQVVRHGAPHRFVIERAEGGIPAPLAHSIYEATSGKPVTVILRPGKTPDGAEVALILRFWRMSGHPAVQHALRNPYFDGLGLPRLSVPAQA
jgi:hypothetical protein